MLLEGVFKDNYIDKNETINISYLEEGKEVKGKLDKNNRIVCGENIYEIDFNKGVLKEVN